MLQPDVHGRAFPVRSGLINDSDAQYLRSETPYHHVWETRRGRRAAQSSSLEGSEAQNGGGNVNDLFSVDIYCCYVVPHRDKVVTTVTLKTDVLPSPHILVSGLKSERRHVHQLNVVQRPVVLEEQLTRIH